MQNNILLGIGLMVVTTFMFSTMDGVSRFLAERNNVFTLVTMRYWFIAIIMIISCVFIKNSLTNILYRSFGSYRTSKQLSCKKGC